MVPNLTVPLAIAGGAAYLYAKTQFGDDAASAYNLLTNVLIANRAENRDRVNLFYTLEDRAQSRKNANVPFIVYQGREWTYREVYDIAIQYATWMKSKYGIARGEVVAIDLVNSELFVFLWMAIWSLGAQPAFINYNLTGEALLHCLRISTARVVFVDEETKPLFSQDVLDKLALADFQKKTRAAEIVFMDLRARQEVERMKGVREPDSSRSGLKGHGMATLIYTSGTTGLPKPGIVSWRKYTVGGSYCYKWLGMKRGDRFYSVPSYVTLDICP